MPEIFSKVGDVILFAIDELPDGTTKTFKVIKIRTTTAFKSIEGINQLKKTIYTESIDLDTNTLNSFSYHVESVEHFYKIKNNATQIYIDEIVFEIPIERGTRMIMFNYLKKGIKFGTKVADVFDKIQVYKEMINMIPELSDNKKFNMPSLSTLVGLYSFIPGAQMLAFGLGLAEVIIKDQLAEVDYVIEQSMWVNWQNVKTKGLEADKKFVNNDGWAETKSFLYFSVSNNLLDQILKGNIMNIDDLKDQVHGESDTKTHTIFTYRVEENEIDDFYDVVDCIFLNE
ncbi:hypothetical protein EG240_03750 [Paenimyroides tangerinum]|uniref:Uncharacterized protein n=1 Tax=Paenimyroides tangerinum TaxID=2488728 RepID=A0A3P3WF75_9FLAO|nr:hypothetical protein [Paenimyroides tangerinum]RRJ92299.1 hypothetical protein EG240_03750 [Paenimyroides tangerinum]